MTGYTSQELVFGKLSFLPTNVKSQIDPIYNFDNYPIELKYRLQKAWDDARNNLIESKTKQKNAIELHKNSILLKVGDTVMIKNNPSNKLEPIYRGPYEVAEEKAPNVVLRIGDRLIEVHKNRVKLYHS